MSIPGFDFDPTQGDPIRARRDPNAQAASQMGLQDQRTARGQQDALADLLMQQAQGRGPSVAERQLRAESDRIRGQTAGLMGSQRGMNPALAARQAATLGAQTQQQTNQQAGQLRAQEMLQGRQALGGLLQGQRQQDLGLFGTGVGIEADLSRGELDADMRRDIANRQIAAQQAQIRQGQELAEQNYWRDAIVGGATGALNSGAAVAARAAMMYEGGTVRRPSEILVEAMACGGPVKRRKAQKMADGGVVETDSQVVPGAAPVKGDSPKNDLVYALLSPGELVLPRTITGARDAPKKAASFMRKHMREIREQMEYETKNSENVDG